MRAESAHRLLVQPRTGAGDLGVLRRVPRAARGGARRHRGVREQSRALGCSVRCSTTPVCRTARSRSSAPDRRRRSRIGRRMPRALARSRSLRRRNESAQSSPNSAPSVTLISRGVHAAAVGARERLMERQRCSTRAISLSVDGTYSLNLNQQRSVRPQLRADHAIHAGRRPSGLRRSRRRSSRRRAASRRATRACRRTSIASPSSAPISSRVRRSSSCASARSTARRCGSAGAQRIPIQTCANRCPASAAPRAIRSPSSGTTRGRGRTRSTTTSATISSTR